MAGVIGLDGVQWEHCNSCGGWVKLTDLGYDQPSKGYPHGRDLCMKCANQLPQARLRKLIPGKDWIRKMTDK